LGRNRRLLETTIGVIRSLFHNLFVAVRVIFCLLRQIVRQNSQLLLNLHQLNPTADLVPATDFWVRKILESLPSVGNHVVVADDNLSWFHHTVETASSVHLLVEQVASDAH
jgi:hypothetical protein